MNHDETLSREQSRLNDLKAELKTLKARLAAEKTGLDEFEKVFIAAKVAGNDLPKQPKDNTAALVKEITLLESAIKIQETAVADAAKAFLEFRTHVAETERHQNIQRAVQLVRDLQKVVEDDGRYVAAQRKTGVDLKEPMALPAGCEGWLKRWGSK